MSLIGEYMERRSKETGEMYKYELSYEIIAGGADAGRASNLRKLIEKASVSLDDTDALDAVELFPNWSETAEYAVGDRVRYDGDLYKCLQPHTSQSGWNPVDASSLWARVLIPDPEAIPDWIQPDSTNPYMRGDKVRHLEKIWISDVDNNVWEPSVYGWSEVTE